MSLSKKTIFQNGVILRGLDTGVVGDQPLLINPTTLEVRLGTPIDTGDFISSSLPQGYLLIGNNSNIAQSRLLSGAISVTTLGVSSIATGYIQNAHISSTAAIQYSKLNLTNSIVNADVDGTAGISRAKLASGANNRLVINNSSGVMTEAATITAARVLISDSNGIPVHSNITTTILGYVDPTSSIQTQLNNRLSFSSAVVPQEGDLIYYTSGVWNRFPRGASGQYLTSTLTGIQWVTTPNGMPTGGTAGQYLNKINGTDFNTQWSNLTLDKVTDITATYSQVNELATGFYDATSSIQTQLNNKMSSALAYNALFVGTASNVAGQLSAGSNGQLLTIVSGSPQWVTPAATGTVSGPGSSTNTALARWNGVAGTALNDSSILLDGSANLTGVASLRTVNQGGVILRELTANGTNAVTVRAAGTMASDYTLTLPASAPASGTFLKYDGANYVWDSSGAGLADGDYGDITVSGGGLMWSIDNTVVTYAKIQNITDQKLLGNFSGGATSITEIGLGTTLVVSGGALQTTAFTGDITTGANSFATTLATVNANVGSFGSVTEVATFTVNGKGLITAASNTTITPAVGSITGLGTGVDTALTINVGSVGAFITFNGALGTPSSGVATNLTGTAIALNVGTATTLTTARNIQGVSFNGSANIDIINGTGFVKATGTTLSYDNSTYLTTSSAASTYQPLDSDLTSWAAITRALGFDTFTTTPSWTNFNSLITGTAPYWSLASGGTLTGNNTITQAGFNTTFSGIGKVIFSPTTGASSVAGFNFGSVAGNPTTLAAADAWYNSSTGKIMARTAGTYNFMLIDQTAGDRIPYASSSSLYTDSDSFKFNGTSLLVGGGTITVSTRVDIRGSGTTSSTSTQRWADSGNTSLLELLDDGGLRFGSNGSRPSIFPSAGSTAISKPGSSLTLNTASGNTIAILLNNSSTALLNVANVSGAFTQSSGVLSPSIFSITPTYNTTSTYAGIGIDLDINPTLTSITGLTHIALRATSGSLVIGTTTLGVTTTRVQQRGIGTTTGILHLWEDSGGTARVTLFDNGLINFTPASISGSSTISNFINLTGSMPSTLTAVAHGNVFSITGAGSSSFASTAMRVNYNAGYTGSSPTTGFESTNANAGTNTTAIQHDSYLGNAGIWTISVATTTGHNYGVVSQAKGGNRNIGTIGQAQIAKNSATNIGVVGFALNTGTTPIQIGGYFGLHASASVPTFASAALIADNGSTTSDIFVARDNGTAVFTIADGGNLGFFSATPVAQQGATTDLGVALSNLGLRASGTAYTIATSGATDFSGAMNHSGASAPIQLAGSAGTSGQVLTSAGAGATPTWTTPPSSSTTFNGITAATGTNTIDNIAYNQQWAWNSLSNGTGLQIASNSTTASSSGQQLLAITLSGANANSTQYTETTFIANQHTGTSSTNVALRLLAAGGTTNYALIVPITGGLIGLGTSSPQVRLHVNDDDASNNSVSNVFKIAHTTSGTPGIGIGVGMLFESETSAGNNEIGSVIESVTTSVTSTSEKFDLVFKNMDAGATAAERLRLTSDGRLYGTALHNNAGSVTGTTNQYIASGTYTPTLFNTTNVAASTVYTCQWLRVGNVVTVSGQVDIDATLAASTATELGMSLPIASSLTAAEQVSGDAISDSVASLSARIKADASNDRASIVFKAISLTNDTYSFTFTYLIL